MNKSYDYCGWKAAATCKKNDEKVFNQLINTNIRKENDKIIGILNITGSIRCNKKKIITIQMK